MDQSTVDTRCLEFCGVWKKNSRQPEFKLKIRPSKLLPKVREWFGEGGGGGGVFPRTKLKPPLITGKKTEKQHQISEIFILCIFISNIIYCLFNIIHIDIHVQLISVVCKHHFTDMYFLQLSCLHDKLII